MINSSADCPTAQLCCVSRLCCQRQLAYATKCYGLLVVLLRNCRQSRAVSFRKLFFFRCGLFVSEVSAVGVAGCWLSHPYTRTTADALCAILSANRRSHAEAQIIEKKSNLFLQYECFRWERGLHFAGRGLQNVNRRNKMLSNTRKYAL